MNLDTGELLRLPPPGGQDKRGQRPRVPLADRRGQLQEQGLRGAQPQGRHLVGRREAVRERGPHGRAHRELPQRLPSGMC